MATIGAAPTANGDVRRQHKSEHITTNGNTIESSPKPQDEITYDDLQGYGLRRAQYSKLHEGEEEKRRELLKKLSHSERLDHPLPKRARADISDSNPISPWARKIILTFGKSLRDPKRLT